MKNTFAVTMTLLLALTLGGSYLGYHIATHPAEGHAEGAAHGAAEGATAAAGAAEGSAAGTTNNAGTAGVDNTNAAGSTGNQPARTAATAEATAPAGDAAAGKEKFAGTCAGCHGANAEGGVGPALKVTNTWTEAEFHAAVREGRAPDKTLSAMMPHFPTNQVTDADIANIHAFIKSLN